MGHSGSGKSTLLKILGLMESSSSGKYYLDNEDVNKLGDDKLSELRMNKIGFVFQEFCLDNSLKAYENVVLPMIINKKIDKKERKEKSIELLKKFGLEDKANRFPKELSGGEQQRICIARALANDAKYILADEPTGNLDENNEKIVMDYLKSLTKDGKCIIVVSHNKDIIKYADKILNIKNGSIE